MDVSDHCKEVYAHHGLAMFRAQCVEQSIVQLIVFSEFFPKHVPRYESQEKWEQNFDSYDHTLSVKTMGQLMKYLASFEAVDASVAPLLREALTKRNHLAHRFFVDHALSFLSSAGRDEMIHELEQAQELFRKAEETLNPITYRLCETYGLTQEMLRQVERELFTKANGDLPSP